LKRGEGEAGTASGLLAESRGKYSRDIPQEKLDELGISVSRLRRIAFAAELLVEQQFEKDTPLAREGREVLLKRFATNMLERAMTHNSDQAAGGP
jgi:hypothetical protein